MADFDAIVVGAGCAGSVAAYELASAGKSVLVVERGNFAGAKNMTGGRIYSHALKLVFPNFEEEAPLERRITHERISLMSDDANFTIDFSSKAMKQEGRDSYSVLRGPFDQWLAGKAEEAGAEFIYGIAVESLVKDDAGKICGVRAGEDEITAEVVLLCDGVNSLLTAEAVGAKRPLASAIAVGIKEVIELPRLGHHRPGCWRLPTTRRGVAHRRRLHQGHLRRRLHVHQQGVHLSRRGGRASRPRRRMGRAPVYQMLEDLKSHGRRRAPHPGRQGGGALRAHGARGRHQHHAAACGRRRPARRESAMMCINLGYQVRGMDYAVAAGMHAGRRGMPAPSTPAIRAPRASAATWPPWRRASCCATCASIGRCPPSWRASPACSTATRRRCATS